MKVHGSAAPAAAILVLIVTWEPNHVSAAQAAPASGGGIQATITSPGFELGRLTGIRPPIGNEADGRLLEFGGSLSPDGNVLAGSVGCKTRHLWDAAMRKELPASVKDWDPIGAGVFDSAGSLLVGAPLHHGIHLWDARANMVRRTLESPVRSAAIVSLDFSPDGK